MIPEGLGGKHENQLFGFEEKTHFCLTLSEWEGFYDMYYANCGKIITQKYLCLNAGGIYPIRDFITSQNM